ncbi:hypothetical protein QCA50_014917 [Cerrena zonata]|uniref:Secreted protein n=1 Tax=Cerrena zonata TaxID=2478898 RepID=A0AAW0FYU9_9APHY
MVRKFVCGCRAVWSYFALIVTLIRRLRSQKDSCIKNYGVPSFCEYAIISCQLYFITPSLFFRTRNGHAPHQVRIQCDWRMTFTGDVTAVERRCPFATRAS